MIAALVSTWFRPVNLAEPETLRDFAFAFPFFVAEVCALYALLMMVGVPADDRA